MTNNNNWAGLSQHEKAQLISIYTKHGYTKLSDITNHYNKFQDGGDTNEEEYYDVINPSVVTASLPDINTSQGRQIAKNMAYRIGNGEASLSNVPRRYYNYVQGELQGSMPTTRAINNAGENIYNAIDTTNAFMPGPVGTINWLAHMGADITTGNYVKVAGDLAMASLMGAGLKIGQKALQSSAKYIKNRYTENIVPKLNNKIVNNLNINSSQNMLSDDMINIYAAFLQSAQETGESKRLNQIALDFFNEVTKPRFLKENEEIFKDIELFRNRPHPNKRIEVDDIKKYKVGENTYGFHLDVNGRNVIDRAYPKKESAAIHEAVSHGTDGFIPKEQQKMYEDALGKLDFMHFKYNASKDWKELRATKNEILKYIIDNNIDINTISDHELLKILQNTNGYGKDYFNALIRTNQKDKSEFLKFLRYAITDLPAAAGLYLLFNNPDNSLDLERKYGDYLNNYI